MPLITSLLGNGAIWSIFTNSIVELLHQTVIVAMIYIAPLLFICKTFFDLVIYVLFKLFLLALGHFLDYLSPRLFILLEICDEPLLLFDGVLVLPEAPLDCWNLAPRGVSLHGKCRGVT